MHTNNAATGKINLLFCIYYEYIDHKHVRPVQISELNKHTFEISHYSEAPYTKHFMIIKSKF